MSQPDESAPASLASSQATEDQKSGPSSGRGTENRPFAGPLASNYLRASEFFQQHHNPSGTYGNFPAPLSAPGHAGGCVETSAALSGLERPRTAFEKDEKGSSAQVPDAVTAALRGRSRVSQDLRSLQHLESEAERCRMALDALSSQKKQCEKQIEGLDEQYDLYFHRLDKLQASIQCLLQRYGAE